MLRGRRRCCRREVPIHIKHGPVPLHTEYTCVGCARSTHLQMYGVWAAGFFWALSEQVLLQNTALLQAWQGFWAPHPEWHVQYGSSPASHYYSSTALSGGEAHLAETYL